MQFTPFFHQSRQVPQPSTYHDSELRPSLRLSFSKHLYVLIPISKGSFKFALIGAYQLAPAHTRFMIYSINVLFHFFHTSETPKHTYFCRCTFYIFLSRSNAVLSHNIFIFYFALYTSQSSHFHRIRLIY